MTKEKKKIIKKNNNNKKKNNKKMKKGETQREFPRNIIIEQKTINKSGKRGKGERERDGWVGGWMGENDELIAK